jgi:hypothetical protein
MLIGQALFSGVTTLGSLEVFLETRVELLIIPFSVCAFLFVADVRRFIKLKRRQKASELDYYG